MISCLSTNKQNLKRGEAASKVDLMLCLFFCVSMKTTMNFYKFKWEGQNCYTLHPISKKKKILKTVLKKLK